MVQLSNGQVQSDGLSKSKAFDQLIKSNCVCKVDMDFVRRMASEDSSETKPDKTHVISNDSHFLFE